MEDKSIWEILVPTEMNRNGKVKPIRTRYHRVWDVKVRNISGGMTILNPVKGHWISKKGELFVERMIPVRVICTKAEIESISDMSAKYYNQEAILYYCVSPHVFIRHYDNNLNFINM